MVNEGFWKDKRVLLTGHTGFKGSWMAMVLRMLGAEVHGIALKPDTDPSLFALLSPWRGLTSHIFDIRNRKKLKTLLNELDVDIVIHMAAQALVRRSFLIPFETFDTNIMGSLALLNALAECNKMPIILVVTSDKVYRNDERGTMFRENDALYGDDPYSASKAACEISVHSFAKAVGLHLVTARAGNVVGGGDFAEDRLLPDAFRAFHAGKTLRLRHPEATRPWQHVLDVVFGYLHYVERLSEDFSTVPHALNFGPVGESLTVREALFIFSTALRANILSNVAADAGKPEKARLELDTRLTQSYLGFKNALSQKEAICWAGDWYRRYQEGAKAAAVTQSQIETYWREYGNC